MRKMRNSGIDWIGQIPEDWSIKRLKSVLCERNESNNPIKTDYILSLTNDRGVIPYDEKGDMGNKSKEDLSGYKLAYPNDIVLNSMNVIIGSVALSKYYGCVSPVYYMLYPRDPKDDVRYYNYIFQTREFQNKLKGYGNGIMEIRMRIQMSKLNTVGLPVADSCTQARIADFLDEKCSKIDRYIEKQQQIIEKLKEYRQSVIAEAVTKGLCPDAPMKDSGIKWVTTVPAKVKISRVWLHYDIILGKMLCTNPPDDSYSLEPYFCAADIHFEGIVAGNRKQMWFSPSEKEQYLVHEGDLLIVEGGAGAGGCAIAPKQDTPTYIQNSIMIVRARDTAKERYLRYLIEWFVKQGYVDVVCNKATIPHFTKDKLACVPFFAFPPGEQEEIANYLDKKCQKIDALIEQKLELLRKLDAYKKSLIYETVTGKLEA